MVKREGLVEEVGKGGKMAHNIIRKIYPYGKGVAMKISELDDTFERRSGGLGVGVGEGQVLIGGESGLPVKLSACCNPAFGDDILGYVTRGNRVSVHQSQCKLLNKLDGDRVISAHWKSVEKKDLKVRKS
jgi:GTP pyrophosphokinase